MFKLKQRWSRSHAGHGLDYKSTKVLSNIHEIKEFNIGHFIINESIFYGLNKVIKALKKYFDNENCWYRC